MASPAQILANQSNARLSTGPTSPEGTAASAQNATKHGLSSAFTVLSHEDQDEFDELLQAQRDEHQPANLHQQFLVEQLAKSDWLLARAQRLETSAFEHLAGAAADPSDPDTVIIAKMFETNPNTLLTLQRYADHAQKTYYRAWRALQADKKNQNEANSIPDPENADLHAALDHLMRTPVLIRPPMPRETQAAETQPARPVASSPAPGADGVKFAVCGS